MTTAFFAHKPMPFERSAPDTVRSCPACRGYSLEKSWCGVCNGVGLVKAHSASRDT